MKNRIPEHILREFNDEPLFRHIEQTKKMALLLGDPEKIERCLQILDEIVEETRKSIRLKLEIHYGALFFPDEWTVDEDIIGPFSSN